MEETTSNSVPPQQQDGQPNNPSVFNVSPDNPELLLNFTNITIATEITVKVETYLERALGFLIIGIIGIVANSFVILILGSSVKIREKIVNTLIIHQSFIDLLACIALVCTAHISGIDQHGLKGTHADVYCFFMTTKWPLWAMMLVSSLSLMFLNIERYISIVYPIFHHTKVTRKRVLMALPVVWLLGIINPSMAASSYASVNGACGVGPTKFHEYMKWVAYVNYIILHFFIPVILVLFLYGRMLFRLRTSVNSKYDATSSRRDDVMQKATKNIFKTMLLITICYAICYSFNCIYIALHIPGVIENLAGHFYHFTVYMVCANSIVNPFVYVIQYHEFQNRVKEMFCGKREKAEDSDVTNSVTMESSAKNSRA